jgi:hypothetical protein
MLIDRIRPSNSFFRHILNHSLTHIRPPAYVTDELEQKSNMFCIFIYIRIEIETRI